MARLEKREVQKNDDGLVEVVQLDSRLILDEAGEDHPLAVQIPEEAKGNENALSVHEEPTADEAAEAAQKKSSKSSKS